MATNNICIFGEVWATVNGINEYVNNEIADLVDSDFDEWGFTDKTRDGQWFRRGSNTEGTNICISVHFDKSLLCMKTFTDLHQALTFIAVQQRLIEEQKKDTIAAELRDLRESLIVRAVELEYVTFNQERYNELDKCSNAELIEILVVSME